MSTRRALIALTLLSCVFASASALRAAGEIYTDAADRYSIQLPEGWKILPKTEIDRAMSQMSMMTGAARVDFIVGFQRADKPSFGYPYILVQRHRLNTPTADEMIKTAENELPEAAEKVADQLKKIANGVALEKPTVDRKRHIIFFSIEMNVVNIGPVKGLSAMMLGKNGIVQLNFYATKADFPAQMPVFQNMLDTFKWEPGYEYDEAAAKQNVPVPFNWENVFGKDIGGDIDAKKVLLYCVLGLVVGIVAATLMASARKSKMRNKEAWE
jgi:uncharacterized membrane-anchored protein